MRQNKILFGTLLWLGCCFFVAPGWAQKDNVYRKTTGDGHSLVRGKVISTSAFKVTVQTNDGNTDVPASEVKKITFSGEPRVLGRARDQFDDQRYEDCLANLEKIDTSPDSKLIKQKMKFLQAIASAKIALRGDKNVTTQAAEALVANFCKSNSDSFYLVPAVDVYAQLLVANGKTKEAQNEFSKLKKSKWLEYEIRGHFFEGEALIHQNKLDEALKSYQALANLGGTDDRSRQFKRLAECQIAKISGMQGNVDTAIAALETIIENENAENTQLFAYAYNALGTCYLKSNQLKKACRAFLHTELLFSSEADAHAEALYNLAKLWPQLNDSSRANRARETLTRRYRNTIWAAKL